MLKKKTSYPDKFIKQRMRAIGATVPANMTDICLRFLFELKNYMVIYRMQRAFESNMDCRIDNAVYVIYSTLNSKEQTQVEKVQSPIQNEKVQSPIQDEKVQLPIQDEVVPPVSINIAVENDDLIPKPQVEEVKTDVNYKTQTPATVQITYNSKTYIKHGFNIHQAIETVLDMCYEHFIKAMQQYNLEEETKVKEMKDSGANEGEIKRYQFYRILKDEQIRTRYIVNYFEHIKLRQVIDTDQKIIDVGRTINKIELMKKLDEDTQYY